MKTNRLVISVALLAGFTQLQAVQISGTAINPALENDGSTVSGDQLVLFVVDRDNNGFGGVTSADDLNQGTILNNDDYILARGSTTSFGPTSGFAGFSSFSFTLGDNDIQGGDEFAVYFFDNTASTATAATDGFYALATDGTWQLPTNNSATFDFNANADSDSFQQLSGVQAVNPVPEPSTFAALAGILALGFAMVRRRRV